MTPIPVNLFQKRKFSTFPGLLFLLAIMIFPRTAVASNQNFPNYKAIGNNVAFWEKIYSHYSLTEAVIHDSKDLSKIYEVIPILGEDLPGASRINSLFEQQVKDKYREILTSLASRKPTTPDEIRVAALFSGQNSSRNFLMAVENVRSQKGQKERFLAGVIDSGRYMQEIKRIIRAYNLPEELAYLPHVESSFNFRAYSRLGAAGIWQFTRGTGKQYLTIDDTIDERLDPILATHAAAKYLKNSYRSLNNWPLALTSYNYGLSGMLRAVNEQGTYEQIFTHYDKGRFKFASRNFYPEFLAALKVAKQLEANRNVKLAPAQSTQYLNLPGYVHLKDIGNHFGISQETIKSLNPALRSSVISGEKRIPKGSVVRLPVGKNTNQLLASIPSSFYSKEQNPSLFHQVRKGDTLSSIARHHGVSLKSLMAANNLNRHATIYLKQNLRVPSKGEAIVRTKQNVPKIIAPSKSKTITSVHDPTMPIFSATKKKHPSKNGYDYLPVKDPTI
jgi:membrane-bound lytic murein transglycosylase D